MVGEMVGVGGVVAVGGTVSVGANVAVGATAVLVGTAVAAAGVSVATDRFAVGLAADVVGAEPPVAVPQAASSNAAGRRITRRKI